LPIAGRVGTIPAMKKLIAGVLLVTAFAGCEQPESRLDKVTSKRSAEPSAAPSVKSDHSGSVEERLARLEDSYAKNAEALDFLNKVYAQQKQQQQAQQREEPAPDAMFAVDIAADVQAGQVEGSSQALVTIVEAWDFA
jgi:hypothetical protein